MVERLLRGHRTGAGAGGWQSSGAGGGGHPCFPLTVLPRRPSLPRPGNPTGSTGYDPLPRPAPALSALTLASGVGPASTGSSMTVRGQAWVSPTFSFSPVERLMAALQASARHQDPHRLPSLRGQGQQQEAHSPGACHAPSEV